MSTFTAAQLAYLNERRLARIATVGVDGTPHVTPVGMWSHNPERDTIDVSGRRFEHSKKFRDVAGTARAAIVIDDLASTDPWRPRGIEIRGRAETVSEPTAMIEDPPRQSHLVGPRRIKEQQVIAAELSATGAQELLAATSAAHLAYSAEDGTPRVIPVGFFWTGTEFVISTATTSPKVAAVKARPDVALSIDGSDRPEQARALSVRGRATVEIVDGLVPEYLAAARKSMGDEAAAEFEKNCREMYEQMARIAIVPSWVRFYDFGAGRMPRFLQELAERNRS